jgi:hypothetical protein
MFKVLEASSALGSVRSAVLMLFSRIARSWRRRRTRTDFILLTLSQWVLRIAHQKQTSQAEKRTFGRSNTLGDGASLATLNRRGIHKRLPLAGTRQPSRAERYTRISYTVGVIGRRAGRHMQA